MVLAVTVKETITRVSTRTVQAAASVTTASQPPQPHSQWPDVDTAVTARHNVLGALLTSVVTQRAKVGDVAHIEGRIREAQVSIMM